VTLVKFVKSVLSSYNDFALLSVAPMFRT